VRWDAFSFVGVSFGLPVPVTPGYTWWVRVPSMISQVVSGVYHGNCGADIH